MSPVLHAFFAQTAEGQSAQNPIAAFLPFVLIALVFYFVFFRPQQKQAKTHQAFVAALKKGDEIVTQGGIIGVVQAVDDRTVTVDVGSGTKLRVLKNQVAAQWKAVETTAEAKK